MADCYIGVFGANGHTGRFVAAELKRRGVRARWIGRNAAALSALQSELQYGDVRTASVEDPGALMRALEGLGAVINCAGPFVDTSHPVIEAALGARIHYLDVTSEQLRVRETIERWDQPAKDVGRLVMPAFAFFGGLADLLATSVLTGWTRVDSIDVAVALDSWHPTAGSRLTGRRNTATRVIVRGGALVDVPAPPLTGTWIFPEPFGTQPVRCAVYAEIITLSRHIEADAITSWMNLRPLADVADEKTPPPKVDQALGRSDQRFVMAVRVRRGTELREVTARGRDIYAVSAPLVVEAASRLLDGRHTEGSGVRSAGQVFAASDFLASLGDVLELVPTPPSTLAEHNR